MVDGPRPERPYDELLARVVHRGSRIRLRRQMLVGSSVVALLALLIAAPLTLAGDTRDRRVETVAGPDGTTAPDLTASTTATGPVTAPPDTAPTTTAVPTPTSAPRPVVNTTLPVAPTTLPSADKCTPPAGRGRIALVQDNALHMVNPDGTCLQRRAPAGAFDQDPAWSPDGTKLAFGRGADITVMDADGANVRRLTTSGADKAPAWSPDGRRIAFSRQSSPGEIWVMDADGSNPSMVYDPPNDTAFKIAWSPDGTRLAYSGVSPGIWVVGVDGSNPTKVNAGGHSPSWGPDGRIAFAAASGSTVSAVFVMDGNFAGVVRLGVDSSPNDSSPSWSHDGRSIAFVRYVDSTWTVFTVAMDTQAPVRVAPGLTPAW